MDVLEHTSEELIGVSPEIEINRRDPDLGEPRAAFHGSDLIFMIFK